MNVSPPSLAELVSHLHSLLPTDTDRSRRIVPATVPKLPALDLSTPLALSTTTNTQSQHQTNANTQTNTHTHTPLPTLLTHLESTILPNLSHSALSPNYYAFITGGATPAALLADWLVSLYDQNLSVHAPGSGGGVGTGVEVAALGGFVELFGLPVRQWGICGGRSGSGTGGGTGSGMGGGVGGTGGGTFTTGATASNILGLALGREYILARAAEKATGREVSVGETGLFETMQLARVSKIQVLSTLPHSSVVKACGVLGIGRGNVISVVKEGTELEVDLHKIRMLADKAGTVSILVVSCGEVNTGLFATTQPDLWPALRKTCDELGIWIHVDGAFGLFARLLVGESGYEHLTPGVAGIELADSITGDAHKLLNVPYDCGFFLTRHGGLSEKVFTNGNAAYLKSEDDGIRSPLNVGLENSRRFRALPVYASLMAYGRDGYVDMLKRQIGLCRRIVRVLHGHERFEVLPKYKRVEEAVERTFMIVLFRATDMQMNEELVGRINGTGRMFVTGTQWEGRKATRIAVSHWAVDVERDGKIVEGVLDEVAS